MFKCFPNGDLAQSTFFMIAHPVLIEHVLSISGINAVGKFNIAVFQQGHHGDQLKCGSGFKQTTGRKIEFLVKVSVAITAQVGNGLHRTGLHLHHHYQTIICIVLAHRFVQGSLSYILKVNINGGL